MSTSPARHQWVEADDLIRWPFCASCLVIRPRDGRADDKPCRGPARVELRADDRAACDPSRDSCTDQTPCDSCPKEETP